MRKLFGYMFSYRKTMAVVIVILLVQAYTDLALPTYTSNIVDIGIVQGDMPFILRTGLTMVILAFVGMTASISVGYLAARVGASVGRNLRERVFQKVVGFSNNEFDHFSTASLITRSTNDIQQIQMILGMMVRMLIYSPILAVGAIFNVVNTNMAMAWIIILAIGLVVMVMVILFKLGMPKFRIMQKLVDNINLVMREILTGLPVIRAFHTEKYEAERFDEANQDLMKVSLFVNRVMVFMWPLMFLIMNGIAVLIIWVGAHNITDGRMQVGDLMAFIQYAMQVIFSVLMVCIIMIMIPRASVAAARVEEVLNSQTSIYDPDKPRHFEHPINGVVEFQEVSFQYPKAEEKVLKNISFVAKPGETTAFIGSTGSGKSTLINLIPRFYDVTEGSITIDGVDIRHVSQEELREHMGYVPQKGVLFSGDIASNILYGNEEGTDAMMEEAARIAQAEAFILEKKDNYKNHISQGGSNVSGGQKQRLSIARAIAKNPAIYIFDDSFSALDYKTDVALRQALKEKTADCTVLIVAQRINTILHAEQIVVLDEGEIVGIGTHRQLLESCEVYQQIASSQLSEEELSGSLERK